MNNSSASLLRRRPDFRRLWLADAASETAFRITAVAIPLLAVITLDASTFQAALLTSLDTLGTLLFGLAAGVLADRARCRRLMLLADLGRALALLSIPVAVLLGGLSYLHLCLAVLVSGILQTLFNVANGAYLPRLLPKSDLVDANSKLAANASAAAALGAGGGGLLVQLLTAPFALFVSAAGYLASAFQLARMRNPETVPEPDGSARPLADVTAGLRFVFTEPILRAAYLSVVVGAFFQAGQMGLTAVYMVRNLQLNPWHVGLLGVLSLSGAVLASFLTPRLAERLGSARALLLASPVYAAGFALMPLAHPGWAVAFFAAGNFLASFAVVVRHVLTAAARQQLTPDHLHGRAASVQEFLTWGAMPPGSLLAGAAAVVVDIRLTLWVIALGAAASALPLLFSPLRRLRDLPVADRAPV